MSAAKTATVERAHLSAADLPQGEDAPGPIPLKNERPGNPRSIPSLAAIIDRIPEYQPRELERLMPARYWQIIEPLGKADVADDPQVQALKAAIRYFICNSVRAMINTDKDTAAKLHRAEVAERTWIECFCELHANKSNGDAI